MNLKTCIKTIFGTRIYQLIRIWIKGIICLMHGVRDFDKNVYISPKAKIINGKYLKIGENTSIDDYTKIHIESSKSFISIGDNCFVYSNSLLKTYSGYIKIGNNCSINDYSIIYGHGGLEIGNNVRIAAQTVIIPMNHNFDNLEIPISEQGITAKGIKIEDDVWIGANVKILDGVIIARGSVIGAGSVVTDNIPAYSIAVGVPAKIIKNRKS